MSILEHCGLKKCRRPITKEQYDRAMKNNSYITETDARVIFTDAERFGYGVYCDRAVEIDGEYYCEFEMGASCD